MKHPSFRVAGRFARRLAPIRRRLRRAFALLGQCVAASPRLAARRAFYGLLVLCLLGACSHRQPPHVEEMPHLVLGIAPFTMPRTLGDLLAGAIPADQEPVEPATLQGLDDIIAETLHDQERPFIPLSESYRCFAAVAKNGLYEGTSMEKWVNVGRCMKADMLLVPFLLAWHEREGGPMGVEAPASVTLEMFLLDVRTAQLIGRYRFEETQTSLLGNLLSIGKFVDRGGQWITATQLAGEGIRTGLAELGL